MFGELFFVFRKRSKLELQLNTAREGRVVKCISDGLYQAVSAKLMSIKLYRWNVNAFEIFTSWNIHQNEDRRLNDFEVIWGIWVEKRNMMANIKVHRITVQTFAKSKVSIGKLIVRGESQKSAPPTTSSKFQSDIHETKSLIISCLWRLSACRLNFASTGVSLTFAKATTKYFYFYWFFRQPTNERS
jgi:hypothetical protein